MVVSNRNLLFQGSIFRGHVSFRGGVLHGGLLFCQQHSPGDKLTNLLFMQGGRWPITYPPTKLPTLRLHSWDLLPRIAGWFTFISIMTQWRYRAALSFPVSTMRFRVFTNLWGWQAFCCRMPKFSPLVKKWPLSIVVGVESDTQRVVLTKSNPESRLQ